MGSRCFADNGDRAPGVARRCFGNPADGLCERLSRGFDRLCSPVSAVRLARIVYGRYSSRIARSLHSEECPGIADMACGATDCPAYSACPCRALAAWHLRDFSHDCAQLSEPWHAGFVSDLPQG